MSRNAWVSIALVATVASSLAYSADRRRSVSVEEAKTLVFEALPDKARRLPKLSVEGGLDPGYPGFYIFSVMWEGASNGSVVYGSYAVELSTGDVFDPMTECTEISTTGLGKLQAKVRARIGLSDAEYHKVKSKGPMCAEPQKSRFGMGEPPTELAGYR
jgi:hypothetical protein